MKLNIVKRTVIVATTLIMALSPISTMADEVKNNIYEPVPIKQYNIKTYPTMKNFEQDISVYVPQINDVIHGHLKFSYNYLEGSWSYIDNKPIASFSNVTTDTGISCNDYAIAYSKNGVVDFNLTFNSNGEVSSIVLRVLVDIYGDINWIILNE